MHKSCANCGSSFEITDADLAFIEKISPMFSGKTFHIPAPHHCPPCREQYRMSHRNERNLYHRKCDLTGKQIISMHSPEEPFLVYEQGAWWSDQYDPLAYGREFDFSRPFFEQFKELELAVPKLALINAKSENSTYTNYSAENRNLYMVVGGLGAEDCYYSYRVFYSKDICDCYDIYKCERCYECSESGNLYNCIFCTNCFNSFDLVLCKDCIGCKNCFGCVNLRNKQFYIYNQPFSEENYRSKVTELKKNLKLVKPDIEKLHATVPHRFAQQVQCENITGDQLWQCKDCTNCYTLKNSRDCAYTRIGENGKDCTDCNFCDNCELQYLSCNNEKNYNIMFSSLIWYCKYVLYSMNCFNSQYLFGCTGMKKHEYCIFNKQYSKKEYDDLAAKIIAHMQSTGEWGEFFPPHISAFGYNETVANDYIPLTEQEIHVKGWKWRQMQSEKEYLGPRIKIPDSIEEVEDAICEQILLCEGTGKPFKIIPQELNFYRTLGLPLPKRCPDQRHTDRMNRLNPRRLWNRTCAKCGKALQSTYAPERPEIIYCESCYLATVH